MKRIIYPLCFLLGALLFNACETDFDLTADWKDITVVYGVVDQNDSLTYVKINKAFLGEGNALAMAQIEDSSSYGENLEVKLQELKNGTVTKTFQMQPTRVPDKDTGVFYHKDGQLLWAAVTKDQLKDDCKYRINIRNKNNGNVISAESPVINIYHQGGPIEFRFRVNKPTKWVNFKNGDQFSSNVSWYEGRHAKSYQVILRFNYKELKLGASDTTEKSIQTIVGTVDAENRPDKEMKLSFANNLFYTMIQTQIQPEAGVQRFPVNVDYIFNMIGEDLDNYIRINGGGSTSIVTERPEYSNIENGIGLFSCRSSVVKVLNLRDETSQILEADFPELGFVNLPG